MAFLAPFVVPLTVASTAASTALSIVGGVQQRKAGQAAAKVAEAEAASVRLIGEIEAADKRREARRLMAAQQVAAQFGRETQARAIEARGQQAQQAGRQAAIGSFVRAGGTILGGAASLGELPSRPSARTPNFFPPRGGTV
jgi:hypothetical protein